MPQAVQFKPIVPEKMKVDKIRLELLNALRAEGTEIKKQYEKTVATWKKKPKFARKRISLVGGNATVVVGTDSEIYSYVDLGTRPHPIRPKRASYLRFRTGYSSKTKPGIIKSFPGGASGPIAYARQIRRHPGTKARKFSETIVRRRRRAFDKRMQQAMKKGAAKLF